jgi:Tol biopolymer transport system component
MKIKLITTVSLTVVLGALLSIAGSVRQVDDPGVLLRAAIEKEEVDGDLQGAIDLYKQIIAKHGSNHAIAAKAQLHIGFCFEKLGKSEAIKAYELVLKNYSGQTEQVAVARARLATLTEEKPAGLLSTEITFEGELFIAYALSSDGTKVAGNVYMKGQNIAVYDLANKKLELITDYTYSTEEENSRWSIFPIWSPDGREIAYLSGGWRQSVPPELRASTLNGKSRLLYQIPKGSILPYDWLPDGSAILTVIIQEESPSALGLVPASGGSFKSLYSYKGNIGTSCFSPDGRFIVFAAGPKKGSGDIYIIGADGKSLEVLTDNPADDKQPRWSPDGKHIIFLSERHGDWALWGVVVKNGKPEGHPFMIKSDMSDSELCNWMPHGLLCRNMRQIRDIFVLPVNPETLEPEEKSRQIPFTPTGSNWCPVWSPDGKYLAFASSARGAGSTTSIVLLPSSGGETRQFEIPENFSTDTINDLRWLPDSSGIGYSGYNEKGNPTLFLLTFANEEWKTWPIPIEWWTSIEWSPDGNSFVYAKHGFNSDAPGIIEHKLENGLERYIYRPEKDKAGAFKELKFSRDYKRLAFRMRGSIMVVDVETGKAHPASSERFSCPIWSPDANQILVLGLPGKKSRTREMFVLPAAGGATKKVDLGSLPKGAVLRMPDWSPDGRKIAYTVCTYQLVTHLMQNVIPKNKR